MFFSRFGRVGQVPHKVVVEDEVQGKMVINDEVMTDYAIQIQCMGSAQRWLDEENNWDGPKYVRGKCWLLTMVDGMFACEQMTGWSGQRQYDLLRMRLPGVNEAENNDQEFSMKIVEKVVSKSWAMKLSHGFGAQLFGGDTLGMLWRKHDGSDCGKAVTRGVLMEHALVLTISLIVSWCSLQLDKCNADQVAGVMQLHPNRFSIGSDGQGHLNGEVYLRCNPVPILM
ncbi:hypothetical protein P153DRAFT_388348 [Dothidotthia symphoricarpi CBS 119687]|uniref:Uncharacterized protein n=1 Tax=Dothidotthia symphoricarpi CBS 119687 TaxID=1392245 RepID=A0A6A6A881_9PLEO|nr:uncharacterized protein P153DRAFT_388348 [Dothidotthia symphoricarpi CBS 119687]KAF2127027.1 hypothetical protein P153DRAFT_388348 [Dothidotthia symphoricarpi CBS 119687]